MAPELIKELILPNRQHGYELRNNPYFSVPIVKSVHKGLESLSYLGPKFGNSNLRLKSEIPKTDLVVFAKYTCRMMDSFSLINSVNN